MPTISFMPPRPSAKEDFALDFTPDSDAVSVATAAPALSYVNVCAGKTAVLRPLWPPWHSHTLEERESSAHRSV